MKRFDQAGSHVVIIAVLLVVACVVGFAGYTIAQRNSSNHAAETTSSTADNSDSATGNIQNKQDLDATAKSLDASSNDLDSSVDASSLDSDLNDML